MPTTERQREIELQKQYFRAKLAAEKQKVDVARKIKEGQGDFVLLDTRDRAAFEKEHIPGALSAPLAEVATLAATLSKEKEYVTYCWHAT
jgi:rhodanese-related sulfurtransferase